jgi:hypothetical protein
MSVNRARTAEEYIDWVKQAVFEVGDLRDCLEFDMEELGRFPAFLDPLDEAIKEVYQSMREGRYAFGREDLPFMEILEQHEDEIPFAVLLKQINETHRRGLDLGPEDQD